MLKGRDWRPAFEFLKKYASLVAPVDNINTSVSHKINGSTVVSHLSDETLPQQQQNLSNGNSQINFLAEPNVTLLPNDENHDTRLRESFKELIQILSTVTRIQDIETQSIVATFRSCKFQLKLSQKSIDILKKYLAQNGHVIILQIIHVWFHIEINETELLPSDNEEESSSDDIEETNYDHENSNINEIFDEMKQEQNNYQTSSANLSLSSNQLIGVQKMEDFKSGSKIQDDSRGQRQTPPSINSQKPIVFEPKLYSFETISARYSALTELVESYENVKNTNPLRVLNIHTNNNNRLCSASIDESECHVAAGFDNSIINLWTLKKSVYYGRKPYLSIADKACEWSIENCDPHEIYSSSDEDEIIVNRFKRKTTKRTRWKNFMEKRCSQNKL